MAFGYRFRSLGTRCPRPCLSGLWADDAIAKYIRRYQVMLAARQQDPQALRRQYESVDEIVLSIDGLQPEKGHETLYVVRELTQKRVWFAKPLGSSCVSGGYKLEFAANAFTASTYKRWREQRKSRHKCLSHKSLR